MNVTTYLVNNVRVSIEFDREKKLNTFIIAFLRCYVQSSLAILYICKRDKYKYTINESCHINDFKNI